jgi:hypothetical protein
MAYDDLTNRIGVDYEALLFALRGLYLAAVAPGAHVTAASLTQLQREAHKLAHAFIERTDAALIAYASEVGADGSRIGSTLDMLRVALAQNIKTVTRAIAGGQTGVAAMLKGATGGMGQLVQQKIGGIEFKAQDSLGRKFPAQTLVKTTIRQFAVQASVDAVVGEAIRLNKDAIFVFTPDGYMQRVALKELPSVRQRIFHPNTRAEAKVIDVPA